MLGGAVRVSPGERRHAHGDLYLLLAARIRLRWATGER